MTERPTPDLRILETRVYRGANVWSYEKVDPPGRRPRRPREVPHQPLPDFTDHLVQMLPGLREHSCSRGRRGGFVERLHEGTWLGHVAEHCALALQQVVGHDIRRGKTREVKGRPGRLQRRLRLRRRAGRPRGGPARRTPGQPPRRGRPGLRLGRRARGVHQARRAHGVRPLDPGDRRRGGLARHPVDPAQPALPRAARPGRPRQADPRHDDLGDLLDRGRRRLRQGPHHQAARRGRPAGAQAGLGPHRRPGGPRRRPDRLPGRASSRSTATTAAGVCLDLQDEAAVREAFPVARGAVAARLGDRRVVRHRQGLPLPDHRRPDGRDRRAGAGPRRRRRHLDGARSWSTSPTPTRAAASATRRC